MFKEEAAMRSASRLSVIMLLFVASRINAQDALPKDLTKPGKAPVSSQVVILQEAAQQYGNGCGNGCGNDCCNDWVCGPPGRIWVRADYLLWWTQGMHLPPLVTTSPVGTSIENAGVLGVPGTTVLFGDSNVNDDLRSGGKITLGAWVNHEQTWGVEGYFFGLERQSTF